MSSEYQNFAGPLRMCVTKQSLLTRTVIHNFCVTLCHRVCKSLTINSKVTSIKNIDTLVITIEQAPFAPNPSHHLTNKIVKSSHRIHINDSEHSPLGHKSYFVLFFMSKNNFFQREKYHVSKVPRLMMYCSLFLLIY